jgi:hypothetical protein
MTRVAVSATRDGLVLFAAPGTRRLVNLILARSTPSIEGR